MSCRAEIATRAANSAAILAVPIQAIRYEDSDEVTRKSDKANVFVAQDGRVHKRSVETGAADDAYIEIVKGIRAGEQIVTGPAKILRFLQEGDRIVAAAAAPPTISAKQ